MSIENKYNSLSFDATSKLSQNFNQRFTIKLFAQAKQERFTLFNILLIKLIEYFILDSKTLIKFVNKHSKT